MAAVAGYTTRRGKRVRSYARGGATHGLRRSPANQAVHFPREMMALTNRARTAAYIARSSHIDMHARHHYKQTLGRLNRRRRSMRGGVRAAS